MKTTSSRDPNDIMAEIRKVQQQQHQRQHSSQQHNTSHTSSQHQQKNTALFFSEPTKKGEQKTTKHKKTDRQVTMPISKLTVIQDITKEKTLNSETSV